MFWKDASTTRESFYFSQLVYFSPFYAIPYSSITSYNASFQLIPTTPLHHCPLLPTQLFHFAYIVIFMCSLQQARRVEVRVHVSKCACSPISTCGPQLAHAAQHHSMLLVFHLATPDYALHMDYPDRNVHICTFIPLMLEILHSVS